MLAMVDVAGRGMDLSRRMSRILLEVYSRLDGVALTAGVVTVLAERGIPCNMMPHNHRDNVFVPEEMREFALSAVDAVEWSALEKLVQF